MVDRRLGRSSTDIDLSQLNLNMSAQYQLMPGGWTPGIVTGTGSDWFGPLNPQAPSAPPEVAGRQWDFPSGYNLNIDPRAYEPIKFSDLRQLADAYDVLRLIIETRKDQMANQEWIIKPRKGPDGKPMTKSDDPLIKEITEFFVMPDGEQFWDAWIKELLEDLFVLDAPCSYIERLRGGKMVGLQNIDGSTIKRVIDNYGRTPKAPVAAYQQALHGLPAVNYTTNDLIYRPRNVRTHKVYGYGPVEQVLMTVNIALRRQLFMLEYYTEGNIPDMFIGVPENWSAKQTADFQDWFDSIMVNQTGIRRRARFIPGGVGKNIHETKAGALTDQADEWLTRICCFAFSIAPTPFIKQMNRATAETAKEQALEEGLAPIQKWVKQYVDYVIWKEWKTRNVEFDYVLPDEQDPVEKATMVENLAKSALVTINEGRDILGLDPQDNPVADTLMVYVPAIGYVPVEEGTRQASVQQEKDENPPAPPTHIMVGADGKPIPQPPEPAKVGKEGVNPPKPKPTEDSSASDDNNNDKIKGGQKVAAADPFDHLASGTEIDVSGPDEDHVVKAVNAYQASVILAMDKIGKNVAEQVDARLSHLNRSKADDDSSNVDDADKIAKDVDLDGFKILIDPTQEALTSIAEQTGDKVIAQIGGPTANDLTNLVNQSAVDYAQARAAEMVGMRYNDVGDLVQNPNARWAITDSTRDMLRSIIANGLKDNIGNQAIKQQIMDQGFGPVRSEMIAFTEIGNANVNSALNSYKSAAKLGLPIKKKWSTAMDDKVDEEICQPDAAVGPIDVDKAFPSGHQRPLGHPRCRCRLVGVIAK